MEILHFFMMPIVWIPIVIVLIILTARNYRSLDSNRYRPDYFDCP